MFVRDCLTKSKKKNFERQVEKYGEWDFTRRRLPEINPIDDTPVLFRKGCDRKSAEEGKDKITGYEAMAMWSYASGHFKEYVLGTEDGMDVLMKVGRQDDPFSIFREQIAAEGSKNDDNTEQDNLNRKPAAATSTQRTDVGAPRASTQRTDGGANEHTNNSDGDNNRKPAAAPSPQREVSSDEEGSPSRNNKKVSPMELLEIDTAIRSSLNAAEENKDADGIEFYAYLLNYFGSRAVQNLLSDKDIIAESMKNFESVKEKEAQAKKRNDANLDFFPTMLKWIIGDIKEKLPMP